MTLGGPTQGAGYTLTGAEAGRIRAGDPADRRARGRRRQRPARSATSPSTAAARRTASAPRNRHARHRPGRGRFAHGQCAPPATASRSMRASGSRWRRRRAASACATRPARRADAAARNRTISGSPRTAIIDQLARNPNYAARDADLLDNGGNEAQRGYIEADRVVLATGGTLYVQNTRAGVQHRIMPGSPTARAGSSSPPARREQRQRLRAAAQRRRQLHDGRRLFLPGELQTAAAPGAGQLRAPAAALQHLHHPHRPVPGAAARRSGARARIRPPARPAARIRSCSAGRRGGRPGRHQLRRRGADRGAGDQRRRASLWEIATATMTAIATRRARAPVASCPRAAGRLRCAGAARAGAEHARRASAIGSGRQRSAPRKSQDHGSGLRRHVRPRLFGGLPRRGGAGRPALRAAPRGGDPAARLAAIRAGR